MSQRKKKVKGFINFLRADTKKQVRALTEMAGNVSTLDCIVLSKFAWIVYCQKVKNLVKGYGKKPVLVKWVRATSHILLRLNPEY